jgi:hypothetical protein
MNMEQELKERLEKAHKESLENPGKKKKGCSECKKKAKELTKLPKVEEIPDMGYEMKNIDFDAPTQEEINLAYAELTSHGGVKESAKPLIKRVYEYIFKEEFDFNCTSCVSNQARKFRFYLGR